MACICARQGAAVLLLIGMAGVARYGAAWAADSAPLAQANLSYTQQLQQGESALQAGRAAQALASAEGAVLADPQRWEGFALAGRALQAMQRYEAAADAFSKAIERAPDSQQSALRTLRRQTLVAEASAAPASRAALPSGSTQPPPASAPIAAPAPQASAPTVAAAAPVSAAQQVPGARARHVQPLTSDAVWVDDATGLMWARPWRYAKQSVGPFNFQQSQAFCGQLKLLGYADWRLPSIDELQRIYLPSSSRWAWSEPSFDPAYGMEEALRRGLWKIGSFSAGGDTFSGGRLLLWSSTPGATPGTHAAVFFGRRYDMDDKLSVGTHLNGVRGRKPFRAYGVCVRGGADVSAAR